MNGKRDDGTLASARGMHHELEEIDELEESIKVDDVDKTPFKEVC